MKNLILTLLLAAPLHTVAQSVPNGDFESWHSGEWSEEPEDWTTDNTENNTTVSKDLDAHEGDFAMRVTAQPIGVGAYGEASTVMEIDAIPPALNFYAKTFGENGGSWVNITFHNNETEMYSETWYGYDDMPEYTLVSVPLNQIEPVLTHARITVSSEVGDFAPGSAWISVDAMEFGEPLGVKQDGRIPLRLYPNPARDVLRVESPGGAPLGRLSVFDALGRKVHEVHINRESANIDIARLPKGVYVIADEGGRGLRGKFVVE